MLDESNMHPHASGEIEERKHVLKVETNSQTSPSNSATTSNNMESPCTRSPRSPGYITLSMFISVEGTTVHPDCKHASKPYHRCSGTCVQRMNKENRWSELSRPGSSPTSTMLSTFGSGRKMDQKCKNASKSSHKGIRKYIKKMKGGKKHSKGSRPDAPPTPFQEGMETSYMRSPVRSPAKFVLSMFNSADGRNEHHKCRHASNLYHKCNETCLDYCIWRPMEDEASERTTKSYPMGSPSPSRENMRDPIRSPARFLLSLFNSADGSNVKKCAYASNPYHKCDETCIIEIEEVKKGNKGPGPGPGPEQSDAHTPFQEHKKSHTRPPKFSANWLVSMFHSADGSEVHKKCEQSSNPYHKCTEECTPIKPSGKKGISKGLKSAAIHDNCDDGGTRNVHPQCKYASSPYHNRCTETCMQRINGEKKESKREESVNEGKVMEGRLAAEPDLLQSSNSPHKSIGDSEFIDETDSNQNCTEVLLIVGLIYLLTTTVEERKGKEKLKRSSRSELIDALIPCMEKFFLDSQDVALPFSALATVDEENVDPLCIDVEEPNHECTETCVEKVKSVVVKETATETIDSE